VGWARAPDGAGLSPRAGRRALQSLVAFVVGFSLFGSQYAETGTTGLTPEFGARLADWREETCRRTLRMIMEAYERERAGQ